eukprot:COSAG05_NODE_11190_length_526_cov_0.810304_1_plen_133_part_10
MLPPIIISTSSTLRLGPLDVGMVLCLVGLPRAEGDADDAASSSPPAEWEWVGPFWGVNYDTTLEKIRAAPRPLQLVFAPSYSAARRRELQTLGLKELRKLAISAGVGWQALEDTLDFGDEEEASAGGMRAICG